MTKFPNGDFENFLVENQHFSRVIHEKFLRFLAIILMIRSWSYVDLMSIDQKIFELANFSIFVEFKNVFFLICILSFK